MAKWNDESIKLFIEDNSDCEYITYLKHNKGQITVVLKCGCGEKFERRLPIVQNTVKEKRKLLCRECLGEQQSVSQRKPFEEVFNIIKNDLRSNAILLTNEDTYEGTYEKLSFRCECGEPFDRTLQNFIASPKGCFCQQCSRNKRADNRRTSFKIVKNEFERRGYILLTTEYINQDQIMEFICPKHNEEIMKVSWGNFHYAGKGCKYCGYEKLRQLKQLNPKEIKNELEMFGYKLLNEYINYHEPLFVSDTDGYKYKLYYGNFKLSIEPRTFHSNNPFTIENIKNWLVLNQEKHELLSDEYINAKFDKLKWLCDKGHEYYVTWDNFKRGKRCNQCNESKGEKRIREWLDGNKIHHEDQKEFKDLKGIGGGLLSYDFYLSSYNMLIEFQGEFHDGSGGEYTKINLNTQKEHDKRKRNYANQHNIDLLEIWYWDFDNIETILENKFNTYAQVR